MSRKKYIGIFVIQFLCFTGILCLFDWKSLDLNRFYGNVFQGALFGFFMTFYTYWDNKRKKIKEKAKNNIKKQKSLNK